MQKEPEGQCYRAAGELPAVELAGMVEEPADQSRRAAGNLPTVDLAGMQEELQDQRRRVAGKLPAVEQQDTAQDEPRIFLCAKPHMSECRKTRNQLHIVLIFICMLCISI